MSKVTTDNTYYAAIGSAIRSKLDTDESYTPSEMADAINSISAVKGIKGAAETGDYRTGFVTISPEDVGAVSISNVKSIGNESTPVYFDENGKAQTIKSYSGNAATASKLESAMNLKIGDSTKSVDGSSDVEFTLKELGLYKTEIGSDEDIILTN